MAPSLEGWPTKAKEAPSPHEVRLAPLDTDLVLQSLGGADSELLLIKAAEDTKNTKTSNLRESHYGGT